MYFDPVSSTVSLRYRLGQLKFRPKKIAGTAAGLTVAGMMKRGSA
jgi:hypothetical protein